MNDELYGKLVKVLLGRLEELSGWGVRNSDVSRELYYTLRAIKLLKELYEE